MLRYLYSTHYGCVIGDAGLWTNFGAMITHDHAVVEVVGVRVNICVVGNRAALVNDDLTAVVQQNVFVDGAIVLDRQVIAEGYFDAMKNLDVLATVFENVAREHGANAISQPVVQAYRRTVIHHPEPDQRLALGIFDGINVSVILGF